MKRETIAEMNCVGIDPGLKGGVAFLPSGQDPYAYPMPVLGKEIDIPTLIDWFRPIERPLVVIERAQAMPAQGVRSMFNYGKGYGKILGALEALSISYLTPTPHQWKRLVLAGTSRDKTAAIEHVRRRYPSVDLCPGRRKAYSDGMADAMCLAEYGRQHV